MATTKPAPPANAVAKDAHWSASLERLRNRQRPTATLTICDDQDVKQRLSYAKQTERNAQAHAEAYPQDANGARLLEDAKAALAAAQEAYDTEAIVLRFQALERPHWEALRKAHPPTEEQADDGIAVNVEALAPELISAASVDGITVEDAKAFLDTWGEGEAAQLFQTAWDLQNHSRMDLGKG